MRYAAGAAVMVVTTSMAFSAAWSQSTVIQQNNVSVNHEGASVTVAGQTVSVDTASTGRVVGDGQPASETRTIGPVTAISADGAFALTVKSGPPSLMIEADKNLLPIVKTEVSDGGLDITTDQSYSSNGRIKVTVTSPNVSDISASGSNEINAEGLSGGELSVKLNGSNNAELSGTVSALTARLAGANHLRARQLVADTANVTVSGADNAAVDARQQIVAEISGAGSIAVYGNPKSRNTQVNGAGRINFVE